MAVLVSRKGDYRGLPIVIAPPALAIPIGWSPIIKLTSHFPVNFFKHLLALWTPTVEMVDLEVEVTSQLVITMAMAIMMIGGLRPVLVKEVFKPTLLLRCRTPLGIALTSVLCGFGAGGGERKRALTPIVTM